MANVLVPNIFITTNYDYIRQYFTNKNYNNSFDSLPNSNDTFLISSKTNMYLESLEHSYNYDSSDQGKLVLKFIDVDGKFEERFLVNPINFFRTKLKQELEKERETFTLGGANLTSERSTNTLYEEVASLDRIYICYGIGNDLRNWTDPMIFQLYKAEIEINEAGLRKYIFTFNISNTVLFKPKLILNLNTPNPIPEFNFANHVDSAKVYLKQEKNQTYEYIVYTLLKKYVSLISSVSEDNIIVILPQFEKLIPPPVSSKNNDYFIKYGGINNYKYSNLYGLKDYFDIDQNIAESIINQYRDSRPSKLGPNRTTINESVDISLIEFSKQKKQYFYVMSSKSLPKNPLHPTLPDWYAPLNKISEGLKSLLNTTDDLVVIEENNTKLLDLWFRFGLITNPNKRCIIIGLDRLINDWLYRNHTSLPKKITLTTEKSDDEWIKLLDAGFNPVLKLLDSNEKNILEKRSSEYYLKYMLTTSKRKNGSNFDEDVILDELVPVLKKYNKEVLPIVTCTNLLKLLDIPIFTNNLKNSNILSLNVDNSQTYIDMLRIAVRSDFDKFFLASIASNPDIVNINGHKPTVYVDELKKLIDKANRTSALTEINLELQNSVNVTGTKQIVSHANGIAGGFTVEYSPEPIEQTKERLKREAFSYLREKNFRDQLREVLIQQFYYLKQAGHDFNNMDATALQKALEGATIPEQKFIKTVVLESGPNYEQRYYTPLEGEEIRYPKSILDPQINTYDVFNRLLRSSYPVYQSSDSRDAEIKSALGNAPKLYSQEEVKDILQKASSLIKMFDKVLVQRRGDADIGNLLLGVAVARVDGIVPVELEDQLRILNHVMLLSYIYNTDFIKGDIPDSKAITMTPKQFSIPQTALLGELMKFASRQMYKISLKTLPFFHLSNFRQMNLKPCFLFSRKMYAIKSNRDQSLIDYDFFNGAYNITGFKHTITTKDAYSQFLLQKITVATADT